MVLAKGNFAFASELPWVPFFISPSPPPFAAALCLLFPPFNASRMFKPANDDPAGIRWIDNDLIGFTYIKFVKFVYI